MPDDPDDFIRLLTEAKFGHLEHRLCTADAPMPMPDKDKFRWHHGDAKVVGPFFNLVICTCPHCGLTFTCLPTQEQANGP